jgi:hypothetical protein
MGGLKIIVNIKERGNSLVADNQLMQKNGEYDIQEPLEIECWENPQASADIKVSKRHNAGFLILFKQKPCDEEPAEDKKHEKGLSSRQALIAQMIKNNEERAQSSKPIRARNPGGLETCTEIFGK